jgi:cyclase
MRGRQDQLQLGRHCQPRCDQRCIAKYGAQCIVVAIDAKRRSEDDARALGPMAAVGPGWDVYSHGGRKNTGLDAVAWAHRDGARGAGEIC